MAEAGENGNGVAPGAPQMPAYAEALPNELRIPSLVNKYQDLPSFAKGVENLVHYSGRSVAIPGNDPKEIEQWKTDHLPKIKHVFADRLPPEKAEEYEFKHEGVDNEVLKNDKILNSFRENAHKLGLSKAQASGLFEQFAKEILPQIMPQASAAPQVEFINKAEDVQALMKETFKGEATQRIDEYRKGVSILKTSIPELPDILNDGVAPYGNKLIALGDHPGLVKLITEIGRLSAPDYSGDTFRSEAAVTAAEAINDIKNNPNNPMNASYKKGWRGDPVGKEKWDDLWRQTTGGR
jgi:hypothetical protein